MDTRTPSENLAIRLVDEFAELAPVMEEHLEDQEGELLPYLFMADVARWAHARYSVEEDLVGRVVDWLDNEFLVAQPAERDLIGLGFVETLPFPPAGAPLLLRLGPHLTRIADELGLLRHQP